MILSDLNLNQPLPIQLSQVTNYVVINDPAFPPLSTIVVNGYDAYGNAISAVQVFPRTAKIVRNANDVIVDPSIPNPIQLSQVTNYIPLYNDDATFPALSTTVVEGYNAYGNAISAVQVFPRTVGLITDVYNPLNVSVPSPIQLSQVANYVQVTNGIAALSTIVVDGYNAYGNAISAVQIFPRQLQLIKEVSTLNWNQTAANPIQLSQVTNYVQLYNDDSDFPALSTVVVNGYDAYGNAISAVQVFPRTASLIYKIDPSTVLDYLAPLPIQLSQVGNYVPLFNDDTDFPALSTVVVNGYDAYGNAISAVQVFPRMVSLVYEFNGVAPAPTPSATPTGSVTPTQTITPTPTPSVTLTNTPTTTITPTPTPSVTLTNTPTPTATPTITVTPTETITPTPTITPTETPTNTPTNTVTPTLTPSSTITPTPTLTPNLVVGYSFNLVSLPYNFPTAGNCIMNNPASAVGSVQINSLNTSPRGFYFNQIDNTSVDRSGYYTPFVGQLITITFTQGSNTAIYTGNATAFKAWASGGVNGYVFGTGVGVPSDPTTTGVATLVQAAASNFTIGQAVNVSIQLT